MLDINQILKDWVSHITGAVIFTALGAAVTFVWLSAKRSYALRYWREQRALRQLLDLPRDQRVVIVLPERTPSTSSALHVDFVAYEDMLACNLVERSFILAGWREEQIEIHTQDDVKRNIALKSENLVLICSNNELTQEVLKLLRMQNRLDCDFPTVSGPQGKERHLKFDGVLFDSPSYLETEALSRSGRSPFEGTLTDYALLAKFASVFQGDRKIILVAGIRAIGTWGAARALRFKSEELTSRSGRKDFAALVHCKFEHWKIIEYEISRIIKVPRPQ